MELTISSSHFFCHFFLLQRENLYPAPMWGPSHELQFFIKCSIMVHFHRVPLQCKNLMESFRNRLLQWGSPMGSQVLPRKPAPAWASFSPGPLVLPETYSSMGFLQIHNLLQPSSFSSIILYGLQVDLAPPGTTMGWRGTTASA